MPDSMLQLVRDRRILTGPEQRIASIETLTRPDRSIAASTIEMVDGTIINSIFQGSSVSQLVSFPGGASYQSLRLGQARDLTVRHDGEPVLRVAQSRLLAPGAPPPLVLPSPPALPAGSERRLIETTAAPYATLLRGALELFNAAIAAPKPMGLGEDDLPVVAFKAWTGGSTSHGVSLQQEALTAEQVAEVCEALPDVQNWTNEAAAANLPARASMQARADAEPSVGNPGKAAERGAGLHHGSATIRMTTASQMKLAAQPFLSSHGEFVFHRRSLVRVPICHVLAKFEFDRSSLPLEIRTKCGASLMCYPPPWSYGGVGCVLDRASGFRDRPNFQTEFTNELERANREVLGRLHTLQDVMDYPPPAHPGREMSNVSRSVLLATLGRFGEGAALLAPWIAGQRMWLETDKGIIRKHYREGSKPWKHKQDGHDELAGQLANVERLHDLLAARQPVPIAALLHEWEALAVKKRGVERYREPSPFPFELA